MFALAARQRLDFPPHGFTQPPDVCFQENGVPSCANTWLLTELAREAWGFQGYITSDCEAVQFVETEHHYANTPSKTTAVTLDAGMDIDCGTFVTDALPDAVSTGVVRGRMRVCCGGGEFGICDFVLLSVR